METTFLHDDIKNNIFNFSIDYLEVYWEFNSIRDIAQWLDSDNSNYRNFEWFEITLDDNIRNYEYNSVRGDELDLEYYRLWVTIRNAKHVFSNKEDIEEDLPF